MKASILIVFNLFINISFSYCQNTLSLPESQSSPKASIEDVAWIAGHWQCEAFGGIAEEIWSPPIGNSMMASFRIVKDGKINFYEIETISEENESLILRLKHFHADLKGWEERDETIDFPLVKVAGQTAYFDGLTFEKISEDELDVYVVLGFDDGRKEEMKFPYKRVE